MTTVLCFGDSNTHGTRAMRYFGERRRLAAAQRWPSVAAAELGPDWELIAEGLPGRTTVLPDPVEGEYKCGLAALPATLESHMPLDVVAIMLGTNDLKHRFAFTADDIALALERLVETVETSGTGPEGGAPAVLVVAPTPIREAGVLAGIFEGGAAVSLRLAEAVGAMAARRGAGFVDAGEIAAVDPVDGIHLDADSHAALGRAIAEALRRVVESRID